MPTTEITGRQIAAARALLGWSQTRLGDKVRICASEVSRLESGEPYHIKRWLPPVVAVLTGAGITFTYGGLRLDRKDVA